MAKELKGIRKLKENIDEIQEIIFDDAVKVFEKIFDLGANEARARAPWTDRTGFARTSIDYLVQREGNSNIRGVLGIGADYGIYLELANGGKYRILRPTLAVMKEILKDEFKNLKIKDLDI